MPANNINRKKWICMDTKAFKKAVLRLNTENAEVVRDYYLNLEESMFAYGEYTMNYLIEKTERTCKIQDSQLADTMTRLAITERELKKEVEQRQKVEIEAKEKLQRALKFNQATKQVEPQEYIYIATTDQYMVENKFKPGGCGTFDLVKSRLSRGKSDSNGHFFVYLRIEQALYATLGGFRENSNKELYIINFDWLVKCIDAIIYHNDKFLLFVNLNREQMVEDTMNKEPVIVAPLIGEEEVELTTILDQDTIDAIKESLTTFNPDNNIIKRIFFENHLKQHQIDHKKNWEQWLIQGGDTNINFNLYKG
jgi:hypothetical protein